ncbi:hypothetical protein D1BOALGB6SA_9748 [Olavius sp. associated proteobacterium Delta 1]|nr:hypothetical protein D1BOALGB6SA_9748 [Olavius sp. associated proteobacterium Delta 1]
MLLEIHRINPDRTDPVRNNFILTKIQIKIKSGLSLNILLIIMNLSLKYGLGIYV